jgi:hypothetical protein
MSRPDKERVVCEQGRNLGEVASIEGPNFEVVASAFQQAETTQNVRDIGVMVVRHSESRAQRKNACVGYIISGSAGIWGFLLLVAWASGRDSPRTV